MKLRNLYYAFLTLIVVLLLPTACQSNKKKSGSVSNKSYQMAREAQDYQSAATFLVEMAKEDSAANTWVYDSLAFYHYFYLFTPGVVRNTHTAKYFAQKGLEANPGNDFLAEIKAKLELEEQNINLAESTFQGLWKKTNDHTYWWILAFIQAHAKQNYKSADSMIEMALSEPATDNKTVRLEHIQERIRETVPAKAAFLYLKSTTLMVQNKVMESANLLNEALKIAPNFYAAKRSIYDLQQASQQRK